VLRSHDKREKVWLNGDYSIGDRQFPRQSIEQITAARARELFDVVRARLGEAFVPEETPVGVVLTGGAARMPGMDEAAGKVFGVTGRLGNPPRGWRTSCAIPGSARRSDCCISD